MRNILLISVVLICSCNFRPKPRTTLEIDGKICTLPKGWAVKLTPDTEPRTYDAGYILSKDTALMKFSVDVIITNAVDTSYFEIFLSDTTDDYIYYLTGKKQSTVPLGVLVESKNYKDTEDRYFSFAGYIQTPFIESELIEFYKKLKENTNPNKKWKMQK